MIRVSVWVIGVFSFAQSALALTITVPVDQPTIQSAIAASADGDEIVVLPGTYIENFNLSGKAVTLRGVDPANPAIVQGTILRPGVPGVSIATVDSGEGPGTTIAGLTFNGGVAALDGGGISVSNSSPTIDRCEFVSNVAGRHGGGVSCFNSDSLITGCVFSGNVSLRGGGLSIEVGTATVQSCLFFNNASVSVVSGDSSGGGVSITRSDSIVSGCQFLQNDAEVVGGGIAFRQQSDGQLLDCEFSLNTSAIGGGASIVQGSDVLVEDCTFVANESSSGGGMSLRDSSPSLTGCVFTLNKATSSTNGFGGGLNAVTSAPTIASCEFLQNESGFSGGGLSLEDCMATLTGCDVELNTTGGLGGGLRADGGGLMLIGCDFQQNSAFASNGGGVYALGGALVVDGCEFRFNTAASNGGGGLYVGGSLGQVVKNTIFTGNSASEGGGVYQFATNATLLNCLFDSNAALIGSGVYVDERSPSVINCTLSGNSTGGVIASVNGATPVVTNTIVWANAMPAIFDGGGAAQVTFSLIEGGAAGVGNIGTDPLFADPSSGDYGLTDGSPAVDAGNNAALPVGTGTDLIGNARIVAGIVDMGALENQTPPPCPGDVDDNGVVDFNDLVSTLFLLGPCPE